MTAPTDSLQQMDGQRPVCAWMMRSKNWEDCGAKAVALHEGSQLCYCAGHANRISAVLTGVVALPIDEAHELPVSELTKKGGRSDV